MNRGSCGGERRAAPLFARRAPFVRAWKTVRAGRSERPVHTAFPLTCTISLLLPSRVSDENESVPLTCTLSLSGALFMVATMAGMSWFVRWKSILMIFASASASWSPFCFCAFLALRLKKFVLLAGVSSSTLGSCLVPHSSQT